MHAEVSALEFSFSSSLALLISSLIQYKYNINLFIVEYEFKITFSFGIY